MTDRTRLLRACFAIAKTYLRLRDDDRQLLAEWALGTCQSWSTLTDEQLEQLYVALRGAVREPNSTFVIPLSYASVLGGRSR